MFDTPEEFYDAAMKQVQHILQDKLKLFGVEASEIPFLISTRELVRHTYEEMDESIVDVFVYNGIKLAEFVWSKNAIKQIDIHKDERDIKRTN